MERTRIARVDRVVLVRQGKRVEGTLHLTPHHLIFVYVPPPTPEQLQHAKKEPTAPEKPKELWITYPIIHTCTLRPSSPNSHHPSSLRLRCRDFTFVCFCFGDDRKARDVYDSIRAWTCKIGRIEKLYAFTYQPRSSEKQYDGWSFYDASQEWKRLGISEKGAEIGWRISRINVDYSFSPTYPALLPVPSTISDNTLNYAGKYRSRVRLPVLTYLHPINNCSITRCSQPLVGVRQNRSIQDEKLLLSIFSTNQAISGYLDSSLTPPGSQTPRSSHGDTPALTPEQSFTDTEALEDELIAAAGSSNDSDDRPHIYGAQQHNLIVDARPTVNAYAMQAVGMGSENMDNYPFATKVYLGIDNIHVMRDALAKVVDTLKDSDITPLGPGRDALTKSGWLKHIANMLDGVSLIARQVGIQHSHVLIHCSDGWDRTSQLSALSQLCLDPFYRTLDGFIVLVEKDWLSFGHMFAHRSGFLSSEKWFNVENDRAGGDSGRSGEKLGPSNALENAFLSAKGFFNKDQNKSRDSLLDSDTEANPMDPDYQSSRRGTPTKSAATETKHVTKVKETAPIFHQFLDATYQLLAQHPTRFEFNERFLRRLLYHLYSCQYGTFLFNSERERHEANVREKTRSVWDYFFSRRQEFLNPNYDSTVNDNERGKERLLFPRPAEVRWWSEVFGRLDAEMNAPAPRPLTPQQQQQTSKPPFGSQAHSVEDCPTELLPPEQPPRPKHNQGRETHLAQSIELAQDSNHMSAQPMALTGVETAEKAVGPGTSAGVQARAEALAAATMSDGKFDSNNHAGDGGSNTSTPPPPLQAQSVAATTTADPLGVSGGEVPIVTRTLTSPRKTASPLGSGVIGVGKDRLKALGAGVAAMGLTQTGGGSSSSSSDKSRQHRQRDNGVDEDDDDGGGGGGGGEMAEITRKGVEVEMQ